MGQARTASICCTLKESHMSQQIDIMIRQQERRDWFHAAGLVFEWIGYPRWAMIDDVAHVQQARVVLVDRCCAERRAHVPPEVCAIVEVESDRIVPLPCEFTCVPELKRVLQPLIGLYTHLSNYNGIQGIRWPLTAPVPTQHARAMPRRAVNIDGDQNPLPPHPACYALPAESGDVLVCSTDGLPLVVQKGRQIMLGLPLISLLARHLTAPSMDSDTYLFSEPVHHLAVLLAQLVARIMPEGACRVAPWPDDARGVFAIRHDYDRPTNLVEVVQREARRRIPPTVHVLADQPPTSEELQAIREASGEVALHGRWLDALDAEYRSIQQLVLETSIGHSAHGGREADGWRGLQNLLAAHRAQAEYTELLSEMHLWPHRIPDMSGPPGAALHPLAMPHHLSFDVNMREHAGDRLSREAAAIFANRGLFTLMNHPDIHVDEMLQFVDEHVPADALRMTLRDVSRWWRATHTQSCFDIEVCIDNDGRRVCIKGRATDDQVGAVLDVKLPPDWSAGEIAAQGVGSAAFCLQPYPRIRFAFSEASTEGFEIQAQQRTCAC